MYITQKEYEIALDGYSFIAKAVKQFGEEYEAEFCGNRGWLSKIDFDSENGLIEIEEEWSYCGCCSNDYENYYLPIEYLWDKDWVGREKEKREQARIEAEKEKAEWAAEREEKQKAERYQKYLAMKEEYEAK